MLSEVLAHRKSLCQRGRGEHAAAEASGWRASPSLASRARALELKAMSTLGELLRERGRVAEACELLEQRSS